jgi:PKD repeat protein
MSILTKNIAGRDVLTIFDEGVVIDQTLPKWVHASEEIERRKKAKKESKEEQDAQLATNANVIISRQTYMTDYGTTETTMNAPFVVYSTPEPYEIKKDVKFDEIAATSLKELTIMIKNGELNNVLSGYGGMHGGARITNIASNEASWGVTPIGPVPVKNGFFARLGHKITGWFNKPEMDATAFFTNVKFESKEAAETYRDRVSLYLKAIHNAKIAGQTALIEKLLGEMIANKYEAMLHTNGYFYAIPEDKVVEFAKKTERGVQLTYVKNFTRPIPEDVIEKLGEVTSYEVFDNYVVMHYDPQGKHKEETRKEEAKRKDPILFGLIAGSRKLYYIADWVDEHCDLTLEKFVDTLGVDKDDFLNGEKPLEPEKIEKPQKRGETKEPKPKKLRNRKKKEE